MYSNRSEYENTATRSSRSLFPILRRDLCSEEWRERKAGHQRRNKKTSRTLDVGARTTRKELQITRIVSESCFASCAATREETLNKAALPFLPVRTNSTADLETYGALFRKESKGSNYHTVSHIAMSSRLSFVLQWSRDRETFQKIVNRRSFKTLPR